MRLDQRLESVRLQLLQAEGRHQEELVRSQTWLCAGGGRPGVHRIRPGRAVHHRNTGCIAVWHVDRLFHPGEWHGIKKKSFLTFNIRKDSSWSWAFFSPRNATKFHVKWKLETLSSPGLMHKRRLTWTGEPISLKCKTSFYYSIIHLGTWGLSTVSLQWRAGRRLCCNNQRRDRWIREMENPRVQIRASLHV